MSKAETLFSEVKILPDIRTVAQVVLNPAPRLREIEETVAIHYVALVLTAYIPLIWKVPVIKEHLITAAELIVIDFSNLRMNEIKKAIMKGVKRKVYARIDANVIYQIISDYADERKIAVNTYLKAVEAAKLKSSLDTSRATKCPEEIAKKIHAAAKQLEAKKPYTKIHYKSEDIRKLQQEAHEEIIKRNQPIQSQLENQENGK